jgi:ABC-2 type transport system ATP-binding protein
MTVIEVSKLQKRYGDHVAVRDVSFEVRAGEIFGIVGPNGSGKTTTVECLTGLRQPDGGTIRVLGLDPDRSRAELRRQVGVQLQESQLPDRLKVWEALDLYSSFYAEPADGRALMDDVGLTPKRNTVFAKLSGGQKQRLSIALALVGNPRIAVLDELTTGLDPQARRDTWQLVRDVRDRGVTVVLVTHFMDEAERLCDRLKIIDHGRTLAEGAPHALIAEHIEPEVVEVYGEGVEDWFKAKSAALCSRAELHGETVFCYLREAAAAVENLRGYPSLRFMHRRGNLEDLFLKLTGREMRE